MFFLKQHQLPLKRATSKKKKRKEYGDRKKEHGRFTIMFDPKQITSSMLGYAPQFVLARFSSVIMGVIVAYGVLLFFLGQPPFFQRVGELGLVMTASYWAARSVRYAMTRVIIAVEGPDAATAPPAAAAASAPVVSKPPVGAGVAPKGSVAQRPTTTTTTGATAAAPATRAREKDEKGLD